MAAIVVVGIDLAGSPDRPTGMCTLSGLRALTGDVFSDDEILAWVAKAKPRAVGIDAPLTLPTGRRTIEQSTGIHLRPCDLELQRRGIHFLPVTIGPMRVLARRGMALRRRLRRLGIDVVEVYPGGAQDVWRIPRKQPDLAALRRGLVRLGVRELRGALSHHELDAVSAALVTRDYARGLAEIYGRRTGPPFAMPQAPPTTRAKRGRAAKAPAARRGRAA
jgi:predicted nuclease with RNAse H fold